VAHSYKLLFPVYTGICSSAVNWL